VGEDFLVGDAAIQKLPSFSMTGATSCRTNVSAW
jgi:hypothetical protein